MYSCGIRVDVSVVFVGALLVVLERTLLVVFGVLPVCFA